MQKIKQLRIFAKQLSEQKIAAANQATDLLENHLRSLDKDLSSFEKELRSRGELSDEEEEAMQDMYMSHNNNNDVMMNESSSQLHISANNNNNMMYVDDNTPIATNTNMNEYTALNTTNNNNKGEENNLLSPLVMSQKQQQQQQQQNTLLKLKKINSNNNFQDLSTPIQSINNANTLVNSINTSFNNLGLTNTTTPEVLPTPTPSNFFSSTNDPSFSSAIKKGTSGNITLAPETLARLQKPMASEDQQMSLNNASISSNPVLGSTSGPMPGSTGGPEEIVDMTPYCICHRPAYGQMIGCDNADCKGEWFHLDCMRLSRLPSKGEAWYCPACRPVMERAALAASNSKEGTRSSKRKGQ